MKKNDIFSEFKGALTEQFILQEMLSQTQYVPYYYSSDTSTLGEFYKLNLVNPFDL